jgi:hypothetical protein
MRASNLTKRLLKPIAIWLQTVEEEGKIRRGIGSKCASHERECGFAISAGLNKWSRYGRTWDVVE